LKLTARNITFSIENKIIHPGESVDVAELNNGLQMYIDLGRILVEDTKPAEEPKALKKKVEKPIQVKTEKKEKKEKKPIDRLLDNEEEASLYLNQNTYTIKKKLKSMDLKSADIDLLISMELKGKNRKKILSFLEKLR